MICPTCGCEVGQFKDKLSELEFEISGMCQDCQDEVFDNDDSEDYVDELDEPAF